MTKVFGKRWDHDQSPEVRPEGESWLDWEWDYEKIRPDQVTTPDEALADSIKKFDETIPSWEDPAADAGCREWLLSMEHWDRKKMNAGLRRILAGIDIVEDDEATASVIVELTRQPTDDDKEELNCYGLTVHSVIGTLVTGELLLVMAHDLASLDFVRRIEVPHRLYPEPDPAVKPYKTEAITKGGMGGTSGPGVGNPFKMLGIEPEIRRDATGKPLPRLDENGDPIPVKHYIGSGSWHEALVSGERGYGEPHTACDLHGGRAVKGDLNCRECWNLAAADLYQQLHKERNPKRRAEIAAFEIAYFISAIGMICLSGLWYLISYPYCALVERKNDR